MNTHSLYTLWTIDVTLMLLSFVVQLWTRRAGIVDAAWSFAIASGALYVAIIHQDGDLWTRIFIGAASSIWFARLGAHLLSRYQKETHEDGRYARMRAASGRFAIPVFMLFFLFQAVIALLFTLPMWVLTQIPQSDWSALHPLVLLVALLLMVVAFWGETTADRQLAAFRAKRSNRGKTLRTGLWAYSRHPNYFFEWLHWFAYPLIGFDLALHGMDHSSLSVWVYALWLYPVLMFVFLYFVTGIPYTEQQALSSRGDDYRRYQADTPLFFPRKPRS